MVPDGKRKRRDRPSLKGVREITHTTKDYARLARWAREYGPDFIVTDYKTPNPLFLYMVECGMVAEVMDALVTTPSLAIFFDKEKHPPLCMSVWHHAAIGGSMPMLSFLVRKSEEWGFHDVMTKPRPWDIPDAHKNRPLKWALSGRKEDMIDWLLDHGAHLTGDMAHNVAMGSDKTFARCYKIFKTHPEFTEKIGVSLIEYNRNLDASGRKTRLARLKSVLQTSPPAESLDRFFTISLRYATADITELMVSEMKTRFDRLPRLSDRNWGLNLPLVDLLEKQKSLFESTVTFGTDKFIDPLLATGLPQEIWVPHVWRAVLKQGRAPFARALLAKEKKGLISFVKSEGFLELLAETVGDKWRRGDKISRTYEAIMKGCEDLVAKRGSSWLPLLAAKAKNDPLLTWLLVRLGNEIVGSKELQEFGGDLRAMLKEMSPETRALSERFLLIQGASPSAHRLRQSV